MALLAPEVTRAISAVKLEEVDNFDPIPAGVYTAQINSVQIKDTKAGTGKYLSVMLQITGPAYQGRVVFDNINTQNPNQVAVDIGMATLKKIAKAIGEETILDTDQMIGAAVEIKVKIEDSPEYGAKNVVKDYKPITGNAPAAPSSARPSNFGPQAGFTPPPAEAPANGATPPWMRS